MHSWRGMAIADMLYYTMSMTVMMPLHMLVSLVCWLLVFTIPMGKLVYQLHQHMHQTPL